MMKVKKRRISTICLMCTLTLLIALFLSSSTMVFAENTKVTTKIPVMQKFKLEHIDENYMSLKGTYKLIALESEIPMPEGSKDQEHTFTMIGDQQIDLTMTYTHAGVYQYQIYQITKDSGNYVYDKERYKIFVYISNNEDSGLSAKIIVKNTWDKKCEGILFQNVYGNKDNSGGLNPEKPGVEIPDPEKPSIEKPDHEIPDVEIPVADGSNPTINAEDTTSPDKDNSNKSDTEDSSSVIKTGDTTNLNLWIASLWIAFIGMLIILLVKRKIEEEN